MTPASNSNRYAPVPGKIPGTTINLGGHEFVLAPLNLDGVQAAEPLLQKYGSASAIEEVITFAGHILLLSLHRNYPDLQFEELLPLLDTQNVITAVQELAVLSGFKSASGESTPAGR